MEPKEITCFAERMTVLTFPQSLVRADTIEYCICFSIHVLAIQGYRACTTLLLVVASMSVLLQGKASGGPRKICRSFRFMVSSSVLLFKH